MKYITVCVAFFALTTFTVQGQDIADHALGLRLGDNDGFGAEISYQKSLTATNRLEFDLGWRDSDDFDAFKLTSFYQWVQVLDGNLNWYYGAGGGLGSVDFEEGDNDDDGIFVFAAGTIGVEYDFDIPLLLSLDFRSELGLIGYEGFEDNFDFDIALGVRYQF